MVDTDIICVRCKKPARIQAVNGVLCIDCWKLTRKENRAIKQQDSLNKCFQYRSPSKVTGREAEIVNEIMCELEAKSLLKKV